MGMRKKKLFLVVIVVTIIASAGVVWFRFLRPKVPPSEPAAEKIIFRKDGKEQTLTDEDAILKNLLLQTLHRLNLQGRCFFDAEKIREMKEKNKLVELLFPEAKEIKISQKVGEEEKATIPADEDGYRILKDVKTTLFVLEDNLGEGLQGNILVGNTEDLWSCWTITKEEGGDLDKSWVGEVRKILIQEGVEKPSEPEIFLVVSAIDGDTIEIETGEKVRYLGIDAPEKGECFGNVAAAKNEELVVGKAVKLYRDITEKDSAGRLLRYVWVEETFVNEFLVREGYALAFPQPPDVEHDGQLLLAEEKAKEEKRGLWQACHPPPPFPAKTTGKIEVDPACSQFNAPGDDNLNKEAEYVCLTNKDTVAINMKGWTVEDGWYGWTYVFPTLTLEPEKSVKVRTGCGKDSSTDLYWCKRGYEIWHNEGDTVYLRDSSRTIIDAHTYAK